MIKRIIREIRDVAEFLLLIVMLAIFRIVGFRAASYISGVVTRLIGKRHRAHSIAYGNMIRAMPQVKEKERIELLDKMWMSLGRIIGEYSYVSRMTEKELGKRVEIDEESLKNIQRIKRRSNDKKEPKGGIIFAAHLGNWDVGLRCLMVKGVKVNALYRPLNNKYVDGLMCKIRDFDPIPKGRDGLRDIISRMKKGEYVVIMADQRVSDGEMVPFFHEDALTTTSIARMALKYGAEIIPARSYRIDEGADFRLEIGAPLDVEKTQDANKDALSITIKINQILEKWIKETPDQWFWVHNRWK